MSRGSSRPTRPAPGGRSPDGRADGRRREQPQPSGGVLGRLLGPVVPPGMSAMPAIRTSLAQGFAAVVSSPALVIGSFVVVLAVWLILLALGYVGAPFPLTQAFALPPLSTAFDTQYAVAIAGQRTGLIAGLGLLVVRAIVVSLVASAILERFEGRRLEGATAVRALRAAPAVLAAAVLSFVVLFMAQVGAVLGAGFALLLQVALPALAVYLLGFVPFVAMRRRGSLPETIRLSIAAARTPGGRHLSFCMLYVLIAFFLPWFLPEAAVITANPSAATWIGILVMTLVHLAFAGALAYRWLAVEAGVVEAVPAG